MLHSNLILDTLPTYCNGLLINTDFRVSILFDLLNADNTVPQDLKITQSLSLYFDNQNINNIKQAVDDIIWFYTCGKYNSCKPTNTSKTRKNLVKIFSFEHDAEYIFSAFYSQYNIDLNAMKYLHWWKFKAMFNCLHEDNLIVKIMTYRAMDLSQIKDKEQRKYYQKLKFKYRLPDTRSEIEKERDFANILG